MRLTTLVRLGAAVAAFGLVAPLAASAARGPVHVDPFAKSIGLKAVGGNAIVTCPPGNSQYALCVAPTTTSPNVVYWVCGYYPFVLSTTPFAQKVKNGKQNKKLPLAIAPYSSSDIFWVNTFSAKKNPKVKKGKVQYEEVLNYTCYFGSSSISGYVLVGIV